MQLTTAILSACLSLGLTASPLFAQADGPLSYTGVNLAGGEFFEPKPGVKPIHGKNFVYPNEKEVEYFVSKGMNVFRYPFRWETVQPELMKDLDKEELKRLRDSVELATSRGAVVILDPHNSARHYGKLVGKDIPDEAFADFWARMAKEFSNNDKVWIGLVNEPTHETLVWLKTANAAIKAIRDAGAKNMILVPGTAWSGAHSWTGTWYGGGVPNSKALVDIVDPMNNYIIEVHQYLDDDSSGTKPQVVSPTVGSERLKTFVQWCRDNKKKAFLGEFGAAKGDVAEKAIKDMLESMQRDRDVWVGWTWWAAGSWWGDYMFSIQPKDGQDAVQMKWLEPYLQKKQ